MTELKDSAAITKANEILKNTSATAEDLKAALVPVSQEMSAAQNTPSINVSGATSMEERRELEKQNEQRQVRKEVTTACWRRLTAALQRAEQREAIANADTARADLATALDALEKAQRAEQAAMADVFAKLERIKQDKSKAGLAGKGKVGAAPEQIDRIVSLKAVKPTDFAPEGHIRQTSINALHRTAGREDGPAKPAPAPKWAPPAQSGMVG
jgi:predicted  nucleic acid-binding Zn-ribbon protein